MAEGGDAVQGGEAVLAVPLVDLGAVVEEVVDLGEGRGGGTRNIERF